MSLWGIINHASNANFLINSIFTFFECLEQNLHDIYNLVINELIKLYESLFNIIEFNLIEEAWNEKLYQLSLPLIKNNLSRIRADKRIGPHNKIILDIIFGSLLGDGHAERRIKGNGTRVTFYQEGVHVSYLLWLHSLFSELGYCNSNVPEIQTRLGSKGIVRKIIRFRTWTFSSFNWIHDLWYINGIKVIPKNIGDFLTPLALAIWIMDDGGKVNQGLKLSTNSYTYSECLFLVKVLSDNFNLKASVQSTGVSDQYQIYIWKESMPLLREIVLPYVHSSMKYKLIN
jgi:ubiquinol-cytochrome c reductase cytochrome b subunit